MRTCPKCGELNGDNNTECYKCGAIIGPVQSYKKNVQVVEQCIMAIKIYVIHAAKDFWYLMIIIILIKTTPSNSQTHGCTYVL